MASAISRTACASSDWLAAASARDPRGARRVAPAFSHKLCEKLRRGVGLVELAHAPEACSGRPCRPCQGSLEVAREPIDYCFAPYAACLLLTDGLPDVPVQAHQFAADSRAPSMRRFKSVAKTQIVASRRSGRESAGLRECRAAPCPAHSRSFRAQKCRRSGKLRTDGGSGMRQSRRQPACSLGFSLSASATARAYHRPFEHRRQASVAARAWGDSDSNANPNGKPAVVTLVVGGRRDSARSGALPIAGWMLFPVYPICSYRDRLDRKLACRPTTESVRTR